MTPYEFDGVRWDGHGAVSIGGTKFGAGLTCRPNGEGSFTLWDGPVHRRDRWCTTGWTISIPLENGISVSVLADAEEVGVSLYLHAGCWSPDPTLLTPWQLRPNRDGLWTPVELLVDGRQIVPWVAHSKKLRSPMTTDLIGSHMWVHSDPEWAAEHLLRLARMPVVGLDRSLCVPARWLNSIDEAVRLCCPLCGSWSEDPTDSTTCCSTGT